MATTPFALPGSGAATLRLAAFPRPTLLTDVVLVVGGALFVALCAQISIALPFTPVPITGQTFAALTVGAALGSLRGATSLLLYLLLGAVGLPVYASHKGGWDVLTGATGGYIAGFVLAAALVGLLAERGWDRRFATASSLMLAGNVLIYVLGCAWLAHSLHTGLDQTLEYGLYPFVPGDIVKLYLAAILLPTAWRAVDHIRGPK